MIVSHDSMKLVWDQGSVNPADPDVHTHLTPAELDKLFQYKFKSNYITAQMN